MFENIPTWWQNAVRIVAVWLLALFTAWLLSRIWLDLRSPAVETVTRIQTETVEREVPVVKGLDELNAGDEVLWGGRKLCVSSIDQSNFQKSATGEFDEPTVIINLRMEGQCL